MKQKQIEALLSDLLALRTRTARFSIVSDLFTEEALSFRGLISSLSSHFTDELDSITFESRLDTSGTWSQHIDLSALQTWINTNVSGSSSSGTIYWIKAVAVYGSGNTGAAEIILRYSQA